jgi:phosphoribosylformylglycinamidine synthase
VIDVLSHPTVASKRFLVTIGDRTVGGLSHRDQMVGPWQVPVADCAVTLADYAGLCRRSHEHGRAHAAGGHGRRRLGPHGGGRSHHQPAGRAHRLAARQAVSANWMAACGEPGEDADLYATVKAVGMELCPALGVSHPGGQGQPVDAHPVGWAMAKSRRSPRRSA